MSSKHVFNVSISGASLKLKLTIFDNKAFPVLKIQELAKLVEDFCAAHQEDAVQLFKKARDMENDLSYWQSEINGEEDDDVL